jgi:hypothetical protein
MLRMTATLTTSRLFTSEFNLTLPILSYTAVLSFCFIMFHYLLLANSPSEKM